MMTKSDRFRPTFIEATTLDDAWFRLLWEAAHRGREYFITSGSFEGKRRLALDYTAGFIHAPHHRPLSPTVPEGSSLSPPCTDEVGERYFANYLMNPKREKNEHYKYASYIVGGDKGVCEVKQLDWVIKHLNASPGNEHCYITIGTPNSLMDYDKPYRECPQCRRLFNWMYHKCPYHGVDLIAHEHLRKTTPCLRGLDFRIIDGALFTHVVYRSWDLVNGWPTNMVGFTLLNEYVASELGIEPGPLAFSCKSLHIYEDCYDYIRARICKEIPALIGG